ncbi:MAG: hypothetical protein JNJ75_04450 [Cyclobacteriaceae bacterium]|nr:hypothetical protein [Cyclobacteriaceae bacterium]
MLLIPELFDNTLTIYAYSHSDSEFRSIEIVFRNANVIMDRSRIGNDDRGRRGYKYIVNGKGLIEKLEKFVGIRFITLGRNTDVEIGGGQYPYKCKRIADLPSQQACETIYADDDHLAFMKCCLLARKRNWLGGDSEPGTCNRS